MISTLGVDVSMSFQSNRPEESAATGGRSAGDSGDVSTIGTPHWLSLAAAPTFGIMALLTAPPPAVPIPICSAAQEPFTAQRNGPHVPAHERLSFRSLVEASLRQRNGARRA